MFVKGLKIGGIDPGGFIKGLKIEGIIPVGIHGLNIGGLILCL